MTTLADLTEEERKACVGMWADYSATLVVYCEELGETMCTVATFPTWREAMSYANRNTQEQK